MSTQMNAKFLVAIALTAALLAAACSSDDNSSSPAAATTDVAVTAAVTQPETETTNTEAAEAAAEAQSLPPAAGADETSEPAATAAPPITTASTSTTSIATTSTTSAAPTETPELPTTTTTSTTTSAAPATITTTSSSTTTTTAADSPAVLRPRQRNDVQLPLPASTPRDRYVPGLADINIYSQTNDQGSLDLQAKLEELSIYLRYIGNYQPYPGAIAANRDTAGTFREAAKLLEDTLLWLGFTPQNVCGAPAGYSFTDLLQPTREWSEELKVYSGDAIFTTDRLIALHGGERINPEANLEFYIQRAVQTAHDMLRLPELLDETEAPQLVLCAAWLAPSGEVPEFSNAAWYTLLTPGIQPQESLLSQGTYHLKEISRNGNIAYVIVCHPTLGARNILLYWRAGGYRAEATEDMKHDGCQNAFEEYTYFYEDTNGTEDTFRFGFGERVFSAGDLLGFPRS